ncbi:uncharacterized protein [Apostichopus japonicus]|uniref:uncharacterized protein isoform X2 n=1 Tax=Stichopus japonicus TaxID=307972 RepID=UPI003AB1AE37
MLSSTLMGYHTAKHGSIGLSPFAVMFGREPLRPVDMENSIVQPEAPTTDCSDAQRERVFQLMSQSRDIIKGVVRENIGKAQERQKKNLDNRHQKKSFEVGSSVLVRNARKDARRGGKLENSWLIGPYEVKAVNEKLLYTLINSTTGLPQKKKFNSILLKEFCTKICLQQFFFKFHEAVV